MKKGFLLFLFAGLLPLAAGPGPLRLATWNVQNYLLQNRWEDGQYRFAYPKPEADKDILRAHLLSTRPDILLLQEIGSGAMLAELREDLAHAGLDYPFSHFSALPESRSGLAILSMHSPDEILHVSPIDNGDPSRPLIRRGVQEVLFTCGDRRIRIFHVHLKSRYTSDEADPDSIRFRTAELGALKAVLGQRLGIAGEGETLLVAGDFNTPFESPFLDPLREQWVPLPVEDEQGSSWTYHYKKDGSFELLDGFWTVPAAVDAFIPVGLFPSSADSPAGSDHRMVVIDWQWLP